MAMEIPLPQRCCNCDRGPDDVDRLVAGFGVYLCGQCAVEMREAPHPDEAIPAQYAADGHQPRCSFCGKRRDQVEYVAVAKVRDFLICSECLVLVEQIVATEDGPAS